MKILSLIVSVALFGVCGAAIAQWQWLDKDGRRVFSDRAPPPDIGEKDILKRPKAAAKTGAPGEKEPGSDSAAAPTAAPASAAVRSAALPGGVDKELEAKKKQVVDAEAAKRKAEQDRVTKSKVENCARAKQAKASFDSGVRISRTNAQGEREILDDTSRAAELKQIQGIIETECK